MTATSAIPESTASTSLGDRLALRTIARISVTGPVPDVRTVSRPLAVAADNRGRVFVTLLMWRTDQKGEVNTPSAVAVIDDATQSIVAYVPVGAVPRYAAVDPITGRVFVTHNAQPKSDTVTVIDGAADQPSVIKTFQVGRNALGVAINPLTRRVYIAHAVDAKLTVIDADTLAVLGEIFLENGIQIDRIAVDVLTNQVYVPAYRFADNPATSWLYVIDGATQTWTKLSLAATDAALNQGTPRSVALNLATRQLYVAKFGNVNTVAVLDCSDLTKPPTLVTILGGMGGNISDIHVDVSRNLVFAANSTGPGLGKIGLGMTVIDGAMASVFTLPKETPQPSKAHSGSWGFDVIQQSGRIYIANPDDVSISVAETARLPRSVGEVVSLGEGRWSAPLALADNLNSAPALISTQPDQVDLFALANDGTLWHQRQENDQWSNGESLGGELAAGPAAVSGPDMLDIFAVGRDTALWHLRGANDQWSKWESLDGQLAAETPAVIAARGALHVFALGTDTALWHRQLANEQWTAWETLGGTLAGAPAALLDATGQLHAFALGGDGALWHLRQQNGQRGAWESLGGSLVSPPAAVAVEPNEIHVFAMGSDNTVQHRVWDGTTWAAWASLGEMQVVDNGPDIGTSNPGVLSGGLSVMYSAPVAVASANKRIDVVAVSPNRSVQHTTLSQGTRTSWQEVRVATSQNARTALYKYANGNFGVAVAASNTVRFAEYVPTQAPTVRMLRPKDLLDLELDFLNLYVRTGTSPQLVRIKPFETAYIIAYFAPQHIVEEAFFEQDEHLQQILFTGNMPATGTNIAAWRVDAEKLDWLRKAFQQLGFPLDPMFMVEGTTDFSLWKITDKDPQDKTGKLRRTLYELRPRNGGPILSVKPLFPELKSDPVARARLANRSWLVFKVPEYVTSIPYTYEGLLDIMRRASLSVAPVAVGDPVGIPSIVEPKPYAWTEYIQKYVHVHTSDSGTKQVQVSIPHDPYTAIELPYRLALSPNQWRHWNHETRVVSHKIGSIEWTELWHTRLEPYEQMAPKWVQLPDNLIAVPGRTSADLSTVHVPLERIQQPGTIIAPSGFSGFTAISRLPGSIVGAMSASISGGQVAGITAALSASSGVTAAIVNQLLLHDQPTIRAIWSIDYKKLAKHKQLLHYQDPSTSPAEVDYTKPTFRSSLDAKDRSELVHLTSNFNEGEVNGRTDVDVARIMLSALGGWIDARGTWSSDNLDIQEWRHRATMGRDHYVRVVYDGYLMPFGHRASLVKITERKFERPKDTSNGPAIAYLRQRMFVVVREPVRFFTDVTMKSVLGIAQPFDLRWTMPFARVEITTLSTPKVTPPEQDDVGGLGQEAFWPNVSGKPYMFNLLALDREGREIHFKLPLLFVSKARSETDFWALADGKDKKDGYNMPDTILIDERRVAELKGQRTAFAVPDKPGDTSFEADALRFIVMPMPGASPPFYPKLAHAAVKVPALKRLMPTGDSHVNVQYNGIYIQKEFGGFNQGQVLFDFVDKDGQHTTKSLDFVANNAPRMGLVTPNMAIGGLSRSHGPIGNPNSFAQGKFDGDDVTSMFGGKSPGALGAANDLATSSLNAARILGGIYLSDIIASAGIGDAPKMTIVDEGTAVVTHLSWNPLLKSDKIDDKGNVDPTAIFKPDAGEKLHVDVELRAPVDGVTAPTSITTSRLEHFTINILSMVEITFETLEFTSRNGSKPDVNAVIAHNGVQFLGDLAFVQQLADKLPSDGFQDPPFLDVTSGGISAGYTLELPMIAVGMFSLQNIAILAALNLPFDGTAMGLRFQFARRDRPFLLSVSGLTGGGFLALDLDVNGIKNLELSLEFGGSLALNLGVAHGGVAIMGGIYIKKSDQGYEISGYVRVSGAMEVLGLICISVEFNLQLTYDNGRVYGQATLKVEIEIAFFSKSVEMSVQREFYSGNGAGSLGSPSDDSRPAILGDSVEVIIAQPPFVRPDPNAAPTFVDLIKEQHWAAYCAAF